MGSDGEDVLERIQEDKQRICSFLDGYLEEWSDEERRWREDSSERLSEMVKGGKMVRGSLVMLTNEFYGGDNPEDALKAAGAIELLHTGLLMHDDIVDRDEYRRGMPTFAEQYRKMAEEKDISEGEHFGTSMAIVAGDISFFVATEILSELEAFPEIYRKVNKLVAQEFSRVSLAEQRDIYTGHSQEELEESEIMELYRDKTARYTFSLPFSVGAVLAGAEDDRIEDLRQLGEKIGVIYQLKDDELGLFGSEEKTGKSLGSDLEENKKTLHRLIFLSKLSDERAEELKEKLRDDLSDRERRSIVQEMKELDVRSDVREEMERIAEEAREDIERLNVEEEYRELLNDLVNYCLTRKR
ncbi:MAG: polyprenyl synthetase family protein [Candidatus Nanosalina sp.]